jgi:hypothetical protein
MGNEEADRGERDCPHDVARLLTLKPPRGETGGCGWRPSCGPDACDESVVLSQLRQQEFPFLLTPTHFPF